ncbi:MAG: hypothetical protein KIT84_24850 [Labilithrix sp.]|nr:hypothetical protein [Labilithrix sp.]MCW5814280.1 hypothetical protein [Labilithrix sp.]
MRGWLLALAIGFAGFAGCKSPGASTGDAGPAASNSGPAYFATDAGIVIVQDGTLKELPVNVHIKLKLQLAPDGTLYGASGVRKPGVRVRDGHMTELPVTWSSAAVAPDGKVWMLDEGLQILDGEKVTKLESPEANDVGVAPDGTVFLARWLDEPRRVYRREGDTWKVVEELTALLANDQIRGFVAGRGGEFYVVMSASVTRRDGGAWRKVELPPTAFVLAAGGVSPKGSLPLVTRDAIVVVDADGTVDVLDTSVRPEDVTAIAFDGQERLWLGGESGVFVLSRKGQVLQRWPVGVLPAAPSSIAVHQGGPALPDVPPVGVRGTIRGKLIVDGKAGAHTKVELCASQAYEPRPRSGAKASERLEWTMKRDTRGPSPPCEFAPLRFATVTDSDGAFELFDVPRQEYILTTKPSERWEVKSLAARGRLCCRDLTQGETLELGDVRVQARTE